MQAFADNDDDDDRRQSFGTSSPQCQQWGQNRFEAPAVKHWEAVAWRPRARSDLMSHSLRFDIYK